MTVTKRQKDSVMAIEEYVAIAPKFKGDIESYKDVSSYLSKYLKYLYYNNWSETKGY